MNAKPDIDHMGVRELRAYVYDLEDRLRVLAPDETTENQARLQKAFGLTPKESTILLAMADGKVKTKEMLLNALYWSTPNDEPEIKIIDVFVCKVRKKLAGSALTIETMWGRGYWLTDPAALQEVLSGAPVVWDRPPPKRFERKVGTPTKKGLTRQERAIEWLRERADADGVTRFQTKPLSEQFGGGGGTTLLRALERGGKIEIITAGKPGFPKGGVAATWAVRVL